MRPVNPVYLAAKADTITNGGATFDPDTGAYPIAGYAVAFPAQRLYVPIDIWRRSGADIPQSWLARLGVQRYLGRVRPDGGRQYYVGTWWDKDNDRIELDLSYVTDSLDVARGLARVWEEVTVYDLSLRSEICVACGWASFEEHGRIYKEDAA